VDRAARKIKKFKKKHCFKMSDKIFVTEKKTRCGPIIDPLLSSDKQKEIFDGLLQPNLTD
jgi:hypothetical protein